MAAGGEQRSPADDGQPPFHFGIRNEELSLVAEPHCHSN
jgi:hypothetical protein